MSQKPQSKISTINEHRELKLKVIAKLDFLAGKGWKIKLADRTKLSYEFVRQWANEQDKVHQEIMEAAIEYVVELRDEIKKRAQQIEE